MFKHPKLSEKLLENIFYNKEEIEDKVIVTSCNLTRLGLIENCTKKKINTKIISIAEYLSF